MTRAAAYAGIGDYRARVGSKQTGEDPTLDAELEHVSRLAELEFGVSLGWFNVEEDVTRLFDGSGNELLELEDGRGRLLGFSVINPEGIKVDTNRDGTFATTFDLTDGWVVGEPANAPDDQEPYTQLRLVHRANAAASVGEILSRWPQGIQNVSVTGTLGSPQLAGLAREYVILVTRDLRDSHLGGAAMAVTVADESLPLSGETWRIKAQIKRALSRRKMVGIG